MSHDNRIHGRPGLSACAIEAIILVLASSCLTLNYHRPETEHAGSPALDAYAGYYYVPALTGDDPPVNYALGYHFGIVGRLGLTGYSEIGIKLAPPESLVYYKQRITPYDLPFICTGVLELGLYSEVPAFNQIVMAAYPISVFTPYAGIKNLFVMGMEGTIFDVSFMGCLFLSCELALIPHLSLMLEYDYSFLCNAPRVELSLFRGKYRLKRTTGVNCSSRRNNR
jgi:hypothetical protein